MYNLFFITRGRSFLLVFLLLFSFSFNFVSAVNLGESKSVGVNLQQPTQTFSFNSSTYVNGTLDHSALVNLQPWSVAGHGSVFDTGLELGGDLNMNTYAITYSGSIYDANNLFAIDPTARQLIDTDGGTPRFNWNDAGAIGYAIDFANQYAILPVLYDPTYTNAFVIADGYWTDGVSGNLFDLRNGILKTGAISTYNWMTSTFGADQSFSGFNLYDIGDATGTGTWSSARYKVGTFEVNNAVFMNYGPIGTTTNNAGIPTGDYAISVWIYPTNIGEDFHMIVAGDDYTSHQWIITPAGEIQQYNAGNGVVYTTTDAGLTANNWYHLVLTRNSTGKTTMYKDGVKLTMNDATDTSSLNSAYWTIGKRNIGTHPFRGKIDEMIIWNTGLNSSQVTELYNSGTGIYANSTNTPLYANVWAGYHFDETGLDVTAVDWVSNHDATMESGATYITGKIISGIGTPDTGEQVLVVGNITATETIKAKQFCITGDGCITTSTPNPFNQSLNTGDSVNFSKVNIGNNMSSWASVNDPTLYIRTKSVVGQIYEGQGLIANAISFLDPSDNIGKTGITWIDDGTLGYEKGTMIFGTSDVDSGGNVNTYQWLQILLHPTGLIEFGENSIFNKDVNITGTTTAQNINAQNITAKNITATGNVAVGGNLKVVGNLSVKRPYWNGYDNSTQALINVNNVQVINISNNADYDAYGMKVTNSQNLTFDMTGDYLCILSPEFYEPTGQAGVITFWYQKNGVDVPWSNSRYTLASNTYSAPAIPFQFDIENPATDYIRFMWWSDNANTIIYSSGALTSPTRPSIPGVLLNCQKVSELT